MNATAKTGKTVIRTVNHIIDMLVLTVILLLLAFGCYVMWDSNQIHSAASSMRYERYKPTIEDNDGANFKQLQELNPDVIGWLTVYGTNIDYPVVQGRDNIKYVNTNAEGRHSLSGAIFLDYRNNPDFMDFNNILYGHHMENRVMFGEITSFSDADFFNARRYGMLFADGQMYGLEFFAYVHVDANDTRVFRTNITTDEGRQNYLDLLMDMAVITRDASVTVADKIVLLSTCSPNSTNGRDILVGRIIDILPEDPFR